MTKRALITGVAGQDGGHLATFLMGRGYEVYGTLRDQSDARREVFEAEFPGVNVLEADLTDSSSLLAAVRDAQPDEIYNLGAITHVGYSFTHPQVVLDVNGKGVLNLLEAVRSAGLGESRIFQASTSEMFGGQAYNRPTTGYNEMSLFHPRSPYGVAKLYGHWIAKNYREAHGMFVSTGILFNHEGERRGLEFVTRKISHAVARIAHGLQDDIVLGDLWPMRDWGYAGDYVRGMWQALQHDEADDFVFATGESHSIEEFLALAFAEIGILDWRPYVRQDPRFMRPAEVDIVLGDPRKAENLLGWERAVSFDELVKLMVQHDLVTTRPNAPMPDL